jgi:hypothetical protein
MLNLYAAWIGILFGFVAGAFMGLYFHRENWLEGYASWPRRMLRLGHISFFGLAFVNLAFALTTAHLNTETEGAEIAAHWCSWLFIVGAVTMPMLCFLSAYRRGFRHLFFIPVGSLILAAVILLVGVLPR